MSTITYPSTKSSSILGRTLPKPSRPIGYAALIIAHNLNVPIPNRLSLINKNSKPLELWNYVKPEYLPKNSLFGHLKFAIKFEGLNLTILKRLFKSVGSKTIETKIRKNPGDPFLRKIWFLYEWILGEKLDLPDCQKCKHVSIVDPKLQYAIKGEISQRHGVENNLPGTVNFCPLVYRTRRLDKYMKQDIDQLIHKSLVSIPKRYIDLAVNVLQLKDSRSSFLIENETPSDIRILRWSRLVATSGDKPISIKLLEKLQREVLENRYGFHFGLRKTWGFVGTRDPADRMPVPVHISAKYEDLGDLMSGLIEFDEKFVKILNPVIAAAALSFGFVNIHPFEDGNGRIHRYLIHHVLARCGFTKNGINFPISVIFYQELDEYRKVLDDYSKPVLAAIEWESTEKGNVKVLNDTCDFYRYFDATRYVEFLYYCIHKAIKVDIPNVADFQIKFEDFTLQCKKIMDIPDHLLHLMYRFLEQNNGKFSKRALKREFAHLTKSEVNQLEDIYRTIFVE